MLEIIFIFPFIFSVAAFFLNRGAGKKLLLFTGIIHFIYTIFIFLNNVSVFFPFYFGATPEGKIVLLITSFLYLCISFYTVYYLEESSIHNESVFTACLMLFLATMSMVCITDHLLVIWIAIEATTLVSAPLIFLHRSRKALEATWKYVLICSVGIALALLGIFFTLMSVKDTSTAHILTFASLIKTPEDIETSWLKAGFIFMLIGYGTKMGLAPMHTWLPDAHSEAPSPVSALLSGALLNCAFLGIFKTHSLMVRAGLEWYSGGVLTVFGLISLWISAIFILQQDNYKRLLAYSSIENMGIIAFGIGIGGISAYGALLHLIHHSLIKSSLFLSAGNILLGFNSKKIHSVGKMPELMPKTFASLMGGFFAISGFPPFGIFLSELLIILGAFQKTAYLRAVFFLFGLFLVFAGMSKAMIRLSFGNFPGSIALKEKWALVISPYILIAASVFLLFYMPDALFQTIRDALSCIGVTININV